MSAGPISRFVAASRSVLKDWGCKVAPPADELLVALLRAKDWSVPGKAHVFYTTKEYTSFLHANPIDGPGKGQSLEPTPFITIEDTPGGKWLNSQIRKWSIEDPTTISRLWAVASTEYTTAASGSVVALVFGDNDRSFFKWPQRIEASQMRDEESISAYKERQVKSGPLRAETHKSRHDWEPHASTWDKVELPNLLSNPNVTSINGIARETLAVYRESSPSSEIAHARISRDLGIALLSSPQSPFFGGSPSGSPESNRQAMAHELGAHSSQWPSERIAHVCSSPISVSSVIAYEPPTAAHFSKELASTVVAETAKHYSETAEVCRSYGTVPGGMLLSTKAVLPFDLHSIELSDAFSGVLTINGTYRFASRLSLEELAILANVCFSQDELSRRIGALSYREAIGVGKNDLVGLLLTRADARLAELIWGYSPGGRLVLHKDKEDQNPEFQDLAEIAYGDSSAISRFLLRRLNGMAPFVFLDFSECSFECARDNELLVTRRDVKLHKVLCTLEGGRKVAKPYAIEEHSPHLASNIARVSAMLPRLLSSESCFAHFLRYGPVIALFRALKARAETVKGHEILRQAYDNRTIYPVEEDLFPRPDSDHVRWQRFAGERLWEKLKEFPCEYRHIEAFLTCYLLTLGSGNLHLAHVCRGKVRSALEASLPLHRSQLFINQAIASDMGWKKLAARIAYGGFGTPPPYVKCPLAIVENSEDAAFLGQAVLLTHRFLGEALERRFSFPTEYFHLAVALLKLHRSTEAFPWFLAAAKAQRYIDAWHFDPARKGALRFLRRASHLCKTYAAQPEWRAYLEEILRTGQAQGLEEPIRAQMP